jgi:threonyl-tRNA synthetase
MKVPYILVVGAREAESGSVALRRLGSNDQEVLAADAALAMLRDETLAPDMRNAAQG